MRNHEGREEHSAAFGRSQDTFFRFGGCQQDCMPAPRKTRLFRASNGIPPQVCWQPAMR